MALRLQMRSCQTNKTKKSVECRLELEPAPTRHSGEL